MSGLKKIGFFSALILPVLLILGVYLGGANLFLIHCFVFIFVPVMDFLISTDRENVPKEAVSRVTQEKFYKLVTFFWVYVQFGVLIWGFYIVSVSHFSWWEFLAFASGMALITGGIGITVAHELGHKNDWLEQLYSKMLLMTVSYMHFFIEHNRGHHVRVATPDDPATSRFGESFYSFWYRSVFDGYQSAWELERERLSKKGIPFWSIHNQMIQFAILPLVFVSLAFGISSLLLDRLVWEVPLFFFIQSVLGFSLLELVNYLEHYGMERRKMESGVYERVTPIHSWNASHVVSNFLLFQLQRHSDHHANAHKRYQVLNHYDESPQLPAGYSAMIILALFPPLWFATMDPRLNDWKQKTFEKPSSPAGSY
jgi:alkane 1-monooxygenase